MRFLPRTAFAILAAFAFLATAILAAENAQQAGSGGAEAATVSVVSLTHSPDSVNNTTVITFRCILSGPAHVVRLVLKEPDEPQDMYYDMSKVDDVTYTYSAGPFNFPGFTVRYRVEVFDGNNFTYYPTDGTFIIIPIEEARQPDDSKGKPTDMRVIMLLIGAMVLIFILVGAIAALISAKSRERDEKKYKAMIDADKAALMPPDAHIVEIPGSGRAKRKHDVMEVKRKKRSDRPADRDLYAADGADALYDDEVDEYYGTREEEWFGEGYGDGYGPGPEGYGAEGGGDGYYGDEGYGEGEEGGYGDYYARSYTPDSTEYSKEYGEWYDQRSYYEPPQQKMPPQRPQRQAPQPAPPQRRPQPQPVPQQQRPLQQAPQKRPPQQQQPAQRRPQPQPAPQPQKPQQAPQKRPPQPQQRPPSQRPPQQQKQPVPQSRPAQAQRQQQQPQQQVQPQRRPQAQPQVDERRKKPLK